MAIGKRLRFEVLKRDGFRCRYCGTTPLRIALEIDHVVPISNGGTDDLANLTTACAACNSGKSGVPLDRPAGPEDRGTAAALLAAKQQGATLGGEALGERRTEQRDAAGRRRLVGVREELDTCRRAAELRSQGLTLKAIAEQLTAEGRQTKRGGRWYASTVRNVLVRLGLNKRG